MQCLLHIFHQLHHLETLYPGMKPLLEGKGISVQAQNSHSVKTIHQRGEQTINIDAKLQLRNMVLQCTGSFCKLDNF